MEHIGAIVCAPCLACACCYKTVRDKCSQSSNSQQIRRRTSLHHVTAKKLKPTKLTDQAEEFQQEGSEPRHFASKLFMDLLNKSYLYLVVFIASAVVSLTTIFFFPFLALILTSDCPSTITATATATTRAAAAAASNSTFISSVFNCRPPISEASNAFDAFAIAFASLFAVPTHYIANSVAAVTLVTLEFAVGKLAVAALTALLVIKVSRVPNNLVLSSRVLIHKPKKQWMLSMRIGILHNQTCSGCNVRLVAVMRKGGKFISLDLPFDSTKLRAGYIALKQEPMTFCHTIDATSPLYGLNFEKGLHGLKKELLAVILSVHGFDDITGRSLGIERRYNYDRWNKTGGHMVLKERGYMADVVQRLSEKQKKNLGSSHSLAIQWPNFNLIKETSRVSTADHQKRRTSDVGIHQRKQGAEALLQKPPPMTRSNTYSVGSGLGLGVNNLEEFNTKSKYHIKNSGTGTGSTKIEDEETTLRMSHIKEEGNDDVEGNGNVWHSKGAEAGSTTAPDPDASFSFSSGKKEKTGTDGFGFSSDIHVDPLDIV